jgi:hypothetical protein
MALIGPQPDCPSICARQAAAPATVMPDRQPAAIVLDQNRPLESGTAGLF